MPTGPHEQRAPSTPSFMPPEATRLFDVALPLLERSAPDRLTFSHSSYSGLLSGTTPAPSLSRGGAGAVDAVGSAGQPVVPNAIARSLSPVEDVEALSA